jgi:hypothetical protein
VVEHDLRDECGNDHRKILTVRTGEVVRRGGIRPHLRHRIDGVGGEESAVNLRGRQLCRSFYEYDQPTSPPIYRTVVGTVVGMIGKNVPDQQPGAGRR